MLAGFGDPHADHLSWRRHGHAEFGYDSSMQRVTCRELDRPDRTIPSVTIHDGEITRRGGFPGAGTAVAWTTVTTSVRDAAPADASTCGDE